MDRSLSRSAIRVPPAGRSASHVDKRLDCSDRSDRRPVPTPVAVSRSWLTGKFVCTEYPTMYADPVSSSGRPSEMHWAGQVGTPISIKSEFKNEIHQHLDVIRKIVNQKVSDENKRDKISHKIASLQNEIDRDRTTIDAVFSRLISLSKVLGDSAENVEPLVQKVERILTALSAGVTFVQLLPKRERPKLLPNPKRKPINDLDDDIPF